MGNLCSGGKTSDPKYENPKKLKKVNTDSNQPSSTMAKEKFNDIG